MTSDLTRTGQPVTGAAKDRLTLRIAVQTCLALVDDGDYDAAVASLLPLMIRIDPATAPIDDALMDAACLFAEYAPIGVDDRTVLGFAVFGYRAGLLLFGPEHPRTLRVAAILADVLQQRPSWAASLAIRDTVIPMHHRRHDPYARAEQQFALADTLQAAGRCVEAVECARHALKDWLPHSADEPDAAPIYLARLVNMFHLCGRRNDARAAIHDNRSCLPEAGTPERRDLAELARTALQDRTAIERHISVCTVRPARWPRRAGETRPATTGELIALLGGEPRVSVRGKWETPEVRQEVVQRYETQSIATIARELGCAQNTVRKILRKAQDQNITAHKPIEDKIQTPGRPIENSDRSVRSTQVVEAELMDGADGGGNQLTSRMQLQRDHPDEYAQKVLTLLQAGLTGSTVSTYRRYWRSYLRWCQDHSRTPLPATRETLLRFIDAMVLKNGLSVKTVAVTLTALKHIHEWGGDQALTWAGGDQAIKDRLMEYSDPDTRGG